MIIFNNCDIQITHLSLTIAGDDIAVATTSTPEPTAKTDHAVVAVGDVL